LRLSELTDIVRDGPDPEILGLSADSRQVQPGFLFAALPGVSIDGAQYIEDAVSRGAVAVVAQKGTKVPDGIVLIEEGNPRRKTSLIAARFYGRQPERIIAVTGTNGKTSVLNFVQQIWESLGYKAACIGTLGVRGAGMDKAGSLTTPDPILLHAVLADLAAAGVTHVAIEASSHGLSQYRLDGVQVSVAGFTNLSRDHLDYHGHMDDYLAAKTRLFADVLGESGAAVLNADISEYKALKKICKKHKIGFLDYGRHGKGVHLKSCDPLPQGQKIKIEIGGHTDELVLPVIGGFQAMNALCALGIVIAERPDDAAWIDKSIKALPELKSAPGRLQLVEGHPEEAAVYVDYAHTPDALENILKALRPHTKGRLFCIVGCGGDRDAGKRAVMGRAADEMADIAIITDDNPRSEDPAKIRTAMMEGTKNAREIGGRREAIRAAVKELKKGDVLVIAGKGHEQGQIVGDRVEPFDDVEEAYKAIAIVKESMAA